MTPTVTLTLLLSEAVYARGAIFAHLERTKEFLRNHPEAEDMVETAISEYEGALKVFDKVLLEVKDKNARDQLRR
jgi:hypothetical protein